VGYQAEIGKSKCNTINKKKTMQREMFLVLHI